MRKLLTWIVVTVGIAALARKLRQRNVIDEPQVDEPQPAPEVDDPADELRRKLADTREGESSGGEAAVTAEATIEERRSDVHEQGRAAIDEMQRSTEG